MSVFWVAGNLVVLLSQASVAAVIVASLDVDIAARHLDLDVIE